MKLKFHKLSGDVNWLDYGAKWVSQKLNNGEFDYWLVLELINMDDACGKDNEGQPRYNVSVSVVSPSQAKDELAKALECCGNPDETNSLAQVEALHSCGVHAVTFQENGNNAHKLMRAARKEAYIQSTFTFGFAMDKAVNRIGTTGWEAMRGDLTAGLSRTIASGSPDGQILAKMHGVQSYE